MAKIKITKDNLTQELLKKLITYDPATGVITRNHLDESMIDYFPYINYWKRWNKKSGEEMGKVYIHKERCNYKTHQVSFLSLTFISARLIYLYMTGSWPKNHVDHINGNSLDNRWCNLRDVTCQENLRNQKIRKNNKSGKTGVDWDKEKGVWQARGSEVHNGKQKRIFLGYFDDLDEAIEARIRWEESQGNFTARHRTVKNIKTSSKKTKLRQSEVEYIRDNYKPRCKINGRTALSNRFGVSREMIRRIVNGHQPRVLPEKDS